MAVEDIDHRIRLASFTWLQEQTALHGEVLPRETLAHGFRFDDQRVPLLGPQGIFKPAILPVMPLSHASRASASISRRSASGSCAPTASAAPSAASGTKSCSTPRTSCRTVIRKGGRWSRMASPSASSITPRSTGASLASAPTWW
jgi:hypothetical protein